ncbi:hypothetical protein AB0J68_32345 [Micromonospora sp. NPDC049580]
MNSTETPVRDQVTALLHGYARAVEAGDIGAVAASYSRGVHRG